MPYSLPHPVRLTVLAWLLVCLTLSLASAYLAPGLVNAILDAGGPHEWMALGLWSIAPALLALYALRALFLRRYRLSVGCVVVLALGFLMVWPDALFGLRLRFYASKYSYDRVVADVEAGSCSGRKWWAPVEFIECSKPVVVTFDWGGLGSAWFGVVYDAADEMAKPAKDRSASWKVRETGRVLSCSDAAVPLGWHYYLTGGDIGGDC